MLLDFDNTQKWLNWIKTKRFYKLWIISPIVLVVILIALWNHNSKLKDKLEETKTELTPIKELYPKLELSAAVAKLIEDHNILKKEINLAKQKEIQKRFVPLCQTRVAEFIEEARNLVDSHSEVDFEVKVLSVNPSNDLFRKCTELKNLFRSASIKAKYASTVFSSKYNVVIKCSEALSRDVINEINQLLKIVFKNTLYFELLKPAGQDSDGNILIYFLGSPSFDNDGCVFYEKPIL